MGTLTLEQFYIYNLNWQYYLFYVNRFIKSCDFCIHVEICLLSLSFFITKGHYDNL